MLNALFPLFFSGSRCSTSNKIKSRSTIPFYLRHGFLRWPKQVEGFFMYFNRYEGACRTPSGPFGKFSLAADSPMAVSRRHSSGFPVWCRKNKVTVHRGIRTKVTHVESFPSNAKGCGCAFPTNLNGRGAMNSLYWRRQLSKMKCCLEKPHPPLNTLCC